MSKPQEVEERVFTLNPMSRHCKRCGKKLAGLNPKSNMCYRYPLCSPREKEVDLIVQLGKLFTQAQPLQKIVADYYGVEPGVLSLKMRKGQEERAQAAFTFLLTTELSYTYGQVETCLDRSYTWISRTIKKVKDDLLLENSLYKREFEEIREIYNKEPLSS